MQKKIAVVLLITVLLLTLFAVAAPAFADGGDYANNPGLQKASVSGQFHGAFQYYEGQRAGWIPEAARQGGLGDTTGPANSCTVCWGGPAHP